MSASDKLTRSKAEAYGAALADALCWFQGFQAANREAPVPDTLDTLRELNLLLKAVVRDSDTAVGAVLDGIETEAAEDAPSLPRIGLKVQKARRELFGDSDDKPRRMPF